MEWLMDEEKRLAREAAASISAKRSLKYVLEPEREMRTWQWTSVHTALELSPIYMGYVSN